MMGERLEELALRRKMLLLRSERLRSDLAADQRYVLQSLSGFDRFFNIARGIGKPLVMGSAGALLLSFLRRRVRPAGFALRALVWVSMARRLLPVFALVRSFLRSRSRRPPPPESP